MFGRGLLALIALVLLTGGTPTVLVGLVGWPLPDDIPTVGDVGVWLTRPLSDEAIVNVLACVCWVAWVLLMLDVLGLLAHHVRHRPVPLVPRRFGPLHALATALVGAVVVAVLAARPTHGSSVATAGPAPPPAAGFAAAGTASADQAEPGTCVVRAPHRGVHDSLWRIAERELGDGHRWPQLYRLNRGLPQADGRTLTNPDLIHPGWVIRLPEPDQPATQPPPRTPPPGTATPEPPPSTTTPPPQPSASSPASTTPELAAPTTTVPVRPGSPDTSMALRPGVVAGTTLGAITAAALLAAGLHHRHRRDRSRRADRAPIVRRLADLTHPAALAMPDLTAATQAAPPALPAGDPDHAHDGDPDDDPDADTELGILPGCVAPAEVAIGHRDGHELVWDLACGTGLGLIGPGALPAARALLATMLGAGGPGHTLDQIQVVTTSAEATALLGTNPPAGLARLTIADNLDAAIRHVEAEQLARLRTLEMLDVRSADQVRRDHPQETLARLVLLATPTPDTTSRLQGLIDGGPTVAITGLLLGPWPPGVTCRVHADGTIGTAVDPIGRPVPDLHGARLCHLDRPATTELLDLLRAAQPHPEPDEAQPAAPAGQPPPAQPPPDTTHAETAAPDKPAPGLRITTFGGLAVHHAAGTDQRPLRRVGTQPRLLLALLCLHRPGVALPDATTALWPGVDPDKAAVRWHATLAQLRKALSHVGDQSTVIYRDGRYQLHHAVEVDLWTLQDAHAAASQPSITGHDRHTALHTITGHYTGPLFDGLDAPWLDAPREAARRATVDALVALARYTHHDDPDQALALLDQAVTHDPHDEALYRHIMRLQARLGRTDAVTRTHRLLASRLAELDLHPDLTTTRLVTELTNQTSQ